MIYESGKNRRDKQKISDEYPGWKIENRTINELNRISFPHITDGFCQRRWNNKKKKKTDMINNSILTYNTKRNHQTIFYKKKTYCTYLKLEPLNILQLSWNPVQRNEPISGELKLDKKESSSPDEKTLSLVLQPHSKWP